MPWVGMMELRCLFVGVEVEIQSRLFVPWSLGVY